MAEGRWLLGLALAALAVALACPRWRWRAGLAAALLLLAATALLAAALLGDAFALRSVWLYSAPQLPWYLKLANLWGGDEGVLLLLATLGGGVALPLLRQPGWAGPAALLWVGFLTLGALLWNPFAATTAEQLAGAPYRGMNAHLLRVWMTFHPPFLLLAYALFLIPTGAALEALRYGRGPWDRIAAWSVRGGWLTLSLGLALGMWWAYEDFTFGQVWHWDPVQTSVFAVWALASAHLHCLRLYQPDGRFRLLHPLLGLTTAVAALLSLAVTRSPLLASSHRYLGDTSLPWWLAGAALLLVLTLALLAGRAPVRRGRHPVPPWLTLAVAILAGCALVALAALAVAYTGALLELPRPDSVTPFFETLERWSGGIELEALRQRFAQWEVDPQALNRYLAPLGVAAGLAGGHAFFAWLPRPRRWLLTLAAVVLALSSALWLQPFARLFEGAGMTSARTVANFPMLDALLVAQLYLAGAALIWLLRPLRWHGRPQRRVGGYALSLSVIHSGAVLGLLACLSATVFDSYAQRLLRYPDDLARPIDMPDGYRLDLGLEETAAAGDGGRGELVSVARVRWQLSENGRLLEQGQGHTAYRAERQRLAGDQGAVRLMCEMLDYRYARTVSGDQRMIHPFIHRGLWRDVQVWFAAPAAGTATAEVPVILKTYPLLSWLWLGLALLLGGAVWAALAEWRRLRSAAPAPRQPL